MYKGCLSIVVVTYNRLSKLKKAICSYEEQTMKFAYLIVVNNCSTDETRDFLDAWVSEDSDKFQKQVIHTKENIGGSGGFYLGQKRAIELGTDWVFVADDDAYADMDMVEQFYTFISQHDMSNISAICAAVLNMDRSFCLYHRGNYIIRRGIRFDRISSTIEDFQKDFFPNNYITYVGTFLSRWALEKVGLCNKDYFIYYDDTEHGIRLSRIGKIYCVPAIKIMHEAGISSIADDIVVSWRDYYGVRNSNHMLLRHYPICYLNNWRSFLQDILFRKIKNMEYARLICVAMIDALFGRLGKHSIYKPGWEIRG